MFTWKISSADVSSLYEKVLENDELVAIHHQKHC